MTFRLDDAHLWQRTRSETHRKESALRRSSSLKTDNLSDLLDRGRLTQRSFPASASRERFTIVRLAIESVTVSLEVGELCWIS